MNGWTVAGVRRGVLAVGLGILLVAGLAACSEPASGGSDGTSASCAAQMLTVTPASVRVGDAVEVRGRYFVDGCVDAVEPGSRAAAPGPMTQVPLILSGGPGQPREIARLDAAGGLGEIDASVTIPADVPPGKITLALGDAEPVTLSATPAQ